MDKKNITYFLTEYIQKLYVPLYPRPGIIGVVISGRFSILSNLFILISQHAKVNVAIVHTDV